MSQSIQLPEQDASKGSLPTVVNDPSDVSYVKSVFNDFRDITPYFSEQDGDRLVRMEYQIQTFSERKNPSPFTIDKWKCLATKFELLNCPYINYTLNINGQSASSSLKTFDIAAIYKKNSNSILSIFADISRTLVSDLQDVPDEPFISMANTEIKIYYPESKVIPSHVHLAVTGYHDGSHKLATRIMKIYPYGRYDLTVSGEADYISILYEKSTDYRNDNNTISISLCDASPKILSTTIYPTEDSGVLVVKLQDPYANPCVLGGSNKVNLSLMDRVFINACGYNIKQVITCYYQTYELPHHAGKLAPHMSISGPLAPI
jgi:hypothetical protein